MTNHYVCVSLIRLNFYIYYNFFTIYLHCT